MRAFSRWLSCRAWSVACLLAAGSGCGGAVDADGDDDSSDAGVVDAGNADAAVDAGADASVPTFSVAATVTGFGGSGLVLQLNGGGDLTVDDDGAFTFPGALAGGASYEVTVAAQPSCPARICSVTDGTGTIGEDDVSVTVTCVVPLLRLVSHNWGAPQTVRLTDDVLALGDGDTAVPRIVTGASTGVGSTQIDSVASDGPRDLIYAVARVATPEPSILVFDDASTVTGDVAPARQIAITGGSDFSGIELDEVADRLYLSGDSGNLYIVDDASTLDGTATPITIPLTSPGAISLDRRTDRLYVASVGSQTLFVFDGARTLTAASTPTHTVTWTVPAEISESIAVDGCGDRLYISVRNLSAGANVFAFDDASTIDGALDLTTDSQAQVAVPDNQVMSIGLDPFGHLYMWKDSATTVRIFDTPETFTGAVTPTTDRSISAVVSSGYGLDVMAYEPP
jgi:6-phosphogluconolactonase